jgi:hypothetical protein
MRKLIYSLISKRIDAAGKKLGQSLEYTRHIARNSLGAFFKFSLFYRFPPTAKDFPPTLTTLRASSPHGTKIAGLVFGLK